MVFTSFLKAREDRCSELRWGLAGFVLVVGGLARVTWDRLGDMFSGIDIMTLGKQQEMIYLSR